MDTGTSLNFHFPVAGAYTPLLLAVENGDAELLNLFLDGGKVNPKFGVGDEDQKTLLKAVLKNHKEMARIFVGLMSRVYRARALALSMGILRWANSSGPTRERHLAGFPRR